MVEELHDLQSSKHVVVFSISALGDLLVAVPVLVQARRLYPDARLTVVCERGGTAAFARDLGIVDQVIQLEQGSRKSPVSLWKNLKQLQGLGADVAIQTLASHGSYGNLLLGATKARIRCGFESGRFTDRLTHSLPIRDGVHYVTQNLDLLRRLGHFAIQDPDDRFLPLLENGSAKFSGSGIDSSGRNGASSPGSKFGRYILISTGCDPRLFFKRWPDRNWSDLVQRANNRGVKSVFVGDSLESVRIESILAGTDGGLNLAGQTNLADLAALIGHSEAVVGTDGMVLHLAAAMGRACVGLFGPTDPSEVGPFGDEHQIVRLGLPCSPCYGFRNVGKGISCRTYECMRYLSVDLVFERLVIAMECNAPKDHVVAAREAS